MLHKKSLIPLAITCLVLGWAPAFSQDQAAAEKNPAAKADVKIEASAPAKVQVKAEPTNGPLFMWKITSDKGSAYLVGSIHLVKPDFYPLPADVEDAFKKSSVLILEINNTKEDPKKLQTMMLAKGMYLNGDSLQNHLSKDTAEKLSAYLADNPQGQAFLMMKPWLASMLIPMTELQKRGFDPQVGIDQHFMNEARDSGKTIDEVESADFQLEMISGFSDDLQEKLLLASLIDLQDTDKDAAAMLNAWKNGSATEMEKVVAKDEQEHPELKPVMEKLIYERNIGMEKKIEDYIASGKPHFIVVGAGHLVGKRGLLELLKAKNFKVEQVLRQPPATANSG